MLLPSRYLARTALMSCSYDRETLQVAGPLLALLGIAVTFHCMVIVTNAILQAHGLVSIPIYTTLIGGLVNVVTDYLLIGIEGIGIYGAAIATVAYCAVIMLLNIAAIHRHLPDPPGILRLYVRPMVATALMAAGAYLSYELVQSLTGSLALAVLISVAAAGLIYGAMIWAMGVITWYDCQLLPQGERIARLLRVRPEESPVTR